MWLQGLDMNQFSELPVIFTQYEAVSKSSRIWKLYMVFPVQIQKHSMMKPCEGGILLIHLIFLPECFV